MTVPLFPLVLYLLQQIITTTTTMTIATIQPVTIPPITPPLLKCQQNHYQTNVTKLGYQSENVLYILKSQMKSVCW